MNFSNSFLGFTLGFQSFIAIFYQKPCKILIIVLIYYYKFANKQMSDLHCVRLTYQKLREVPTTNVAGQDRYCKTWATRYKTQVKSGLVKLGKG